MLATNHVLAGAVIGTYTANPAVGFAAGVLSHFAMDLIPHWGPDRSDAEVAHRQYLAVARTDGLLLLAAGLAVVLAAPEAQRIAVAAAAFGALLPDLDKPFEHFFGRFVAHRPLWGVWFARINERLQPEAPSRWWVEVAGAITFVALLLAKL